MPLSDPDTVRSPDWWLIRLGRALRDRQKDLDLYAKYYCGDHPLPQGPLRDQRELVDAFREFQRKSRTNFCRVPVRATVNRQLVLGVTDETGKADTTAWGWWQRNKMDSRQKVLFRSLGSTGLGYVMVGPRPGDVRHPLITVESPREVITEADPATGEILAGMKAWWDPIERRGRATVFIDDHLFRYRTDSEFSQSRRMPWSEASWSPVSDAQNTMGRPPFAVAEREPELDADPEPDFWGVRDIQDRINMSVFNRMTIERYAAHPQKWATGTKVEKVYDQITGLEVPVNPYRPGPDGVWINESADGKFGHIPAADLLGVIKSHEFDIRTLFVLTSTPAYYMPGDLVNVSTDTVMALETNHVAKVNELNTGLGECLEEVFALAALVAGDERDFSGHEVRWKDPRQLNPGVISDMGVKQKTIGYPLTVIAENMGESPQRVDRIRVESAAQAAQAALFPQPEPEVPTGPIQLEIPDDLQGLV